MLHFHKYDVISSKIGYGIAIDSLTLQERKGVEMTEILYQCKTCKKFKVKNISGHWEIDKLNKFAEAISENERRKS